jgi:hypothetical protein
LVSRGCRAISRRTDDYPRHVPGLEAAVLDSLVIGEPVKVFGLCNSYGDEKKGKGQERDKRGDTHILKGGRRQEVREARGNTCSAQNSSL